MPVPGLPDLEERLLELTQTSWAHIASQYCFVSSPYKLYAMGGGVEWEAKHDLWQSSEDIERVASLEAELEAFAEAEDAKASHCQVTHCPTHSKFLIARSVRSSYSEDDRLRRRDAQCCFVSLSYELYWDKLGVNVLMMLRAAARHYALALVCFGLLAEC